MQTSKKFSNRPKGSTNNHHQALNEYQTRMGIASVKNTVNVDKISIEPGNDFYEWKRVTKLLLKQRECALMTVRWNVTKSIINQAIQNFATNNGLCIDTIWDFDDSYHDTTLKELYSVIDSWNGVQLTRLRSNTMNCFKRYYVIGKNWYDQNKKKVWAPYFWIKIFRQINKDIKQYILNNKCILLQQELSHYLELQIVDMIFDGTVQFAQTKQQPLIPNGTLKQCVCIKDYLFNLDSSLTVDKWCDIQTIKQKAADGVHNKKRKRTGNAKLLVLQLKDTLSNLLLISHNKVSNTNIYCKDPLHCIHNTSDATNSVNQREKEIDHNMPIFENVSSSNTSCFEQYQSPNTNDIRTIPTPKLQPRLPPKPLPPSMSSVSHHHQQSQWQSNTAYKPSHYALQTVRAKRYNPFQRMTSSVLYNNVNAPYNANDCCCECCQCSTSYPQCQCSECYQYTQNHKKSSRDYATNVYGNDNTYDANYYCSTNDGYNAQFKQSPY